MDQAATDVLAPSPDLTAVNALDEPKEEPDVIDYEFLSLNDDERTEMKKLEEAARAENMFSPLEYEEEVPLPGRPNDYVVFKRIDAYRVRHWMSLSSDVKVSQQEDEDAAPSGVMNVHRAASYIYLCQVGVERYHITTAGGQTLKGGANKQSGTASDRRETLKEIRAVFGSLPHNLANWLEMMILTHNGLTEERRSLEDASPD